MINTIPGMLSLRKRLRDKMEKKKFKVTIIAYCEAPDVTQAGLKACDARLIAGCEHEDLTIKSTEITEAKE